MIFAGGAVHKAARELTKNWAKYNVKVAPCYPNDTKPTSLISERGNLEA